MDTKLKVGDTVLWTYLHCTNSKTCFDRTKAGVIKAIKGKKASVLFRGNKHTAWKPLRKLSLA